MDGKAGSWPSAAPSNEETDILEYGTVKGPIVSNVMEPILEFSIALPPKGSRDRTRSLHEQLRKAIVDGRLRPCLRLPPTRSLASTLGVSRNTVVAVYDLLLAEGYLTVQQGAGTFVADMLPDRIEPKAQAGTLLADPRLAATWRTPPQTLETMSGSFRYDFRLCQPDQSLFPFDIWRSLSARVLRDLSRTRPTDDDPQGRLVLREAIANHVSFMRAVACDADDVVVSGSAEQACDLLARVLVTPGKTIVGMEDPGYTPVAANLAASGAEVVPVPVDDQGLMVDRLPDGASIVYVTPAHQFPLGLPMSARRRSALLNYAHRHRAVIIEDDYDGEFRFGDRPLDALQTLDRTDSVIYVGTFSKRLFPMLRLGFMVVPPWARSAIVTAKQLADSHSSIAMQDTMAAFILEGHLARHIRKMRRVYAERRAALLAALEKHCSGWLEPVPSIAGLYIAAWLGPEIASKDFAEGAAEAGIAVEPIARYAVAKPAPNGLAFGLGGIEATRIDEAIARLAELKFNMF